MPRLLQIAQLGHPVLRQTALEIEDPRTPAVTSLIQDMAATMADSAGVGIAAPQVYESLRLFIMASRPNARYPDAPDLPRQLVINPQILSAGDEMESGWEGCLSIPGIRALVPRHKKIKVRFQTLEMTFEETVYEGFIARIFQHEFDHLNGKVYLDRVFSNKDIISEKEFMKQFTA